MPDRGEPGRLAPEQGRWADAAAFVLLALLTLLWSGTGLIPALIPTPGGPAGHHLAAVTAPTTPVGPDAALSQAQLDAAAAAAVADWQSARPSADLSALGFAVTDLPDLELGAESGTTVTVDVDAAGWGWTAMDLPTVLRHEIGHYLGYAHTDTGLMAPTLAAGQSWPVPAEYAETTATTTDPGTGTTSTDSTATGSTTTDPSTTGSTTTGSTTTGSTTTDPSTTGSTTTGSTTTDPSTTGSTTTGSTTTSGGTDPAGTTTGGSSTSGDTTTATGSSGGSTTSGTAPRLASLSTATPSTLATTCSPGAATICGTDGNDTVVISESGGVITVTVNGTSQTIAAGDDLTVDTGAGDDQVTITATTYTGTVTLTGGDGTDTLTSPDLAGTWRITGVDAGSYQATGGAKVDFTGVESLVGAASAADTMTFADHAGLTGDVDDGAGTLTVTVAGFVTVAGDYDFAGSDQQVAVVASAGATPVDTDAHVLVLTGSSAEGFVGIDVLGTRTGISGTLGTFTLAVVAAGDQAWQAFSGTMATPSFIAPLDVDLSLELDSATIGVNTASADGSWIDFSGAGISGLSFTAVQLKAGVPVRLHLGDVFFVQGQLTLTRGGVASVDIDTGLDSTTGAGLLGAVTEATSDPTDGSLARSADFGTLWNVKVSSLELSFTGANLFAGSGFGWTDANSNGVLEKAEISEGAIGLFGGGIDLAFLILTPIGGMPITSRFIGLKGRASTMGLVGLDDLLTLTATQLQIEANIGSVLASGGTEATVDWGDPGYALTDGPDPLVLGLTGPLVRISADNVLLGISSFLYLSGGFSMTFGGSEDVDVDVSGVTDTQWDTITAAVAGDTDTGVTADDTDKTLHGVHVGTTLIGISGATLFAGYDPSGFSETNPPSAANTGDAFGLLATGINVGMVLATPEAGQLGDFELPSFVAIKAAIGTFEFLGIPTGYFTLSFKGLAVSVNSGGPVKRVTGTSSSTTDPPATSVAVIDWTSSFPADGDADAGLAIPTGTAPDAPVVRMDLVDPVVAVQAERVLLTISSFVYVSGGFSLVAGSFADVDVDVHGITQPQWQGIVTQINDEDPSDGSIATTAADAAERTVYNLRVQLTQLGISDATIFVGYDPTGFNVDTPPDATRTADAYGILATGIDVGMVFASPVADQAALGDYAFSSFLAVQARIDLVTFPGIPSEYFEFLLEGTTLAVNSGGVVKNGTTVLSATATGPDTSLAVIDWAASFSDTGGLEVATGAVPDPDAAPGEEPDLTVLVAMVDPIVGVAADRVLLKISDFVYVSGGFSFVTGQQERVDVDVSGLSSADWAALRTAVEPEGSTPGENDLQVADSGRTILNLLVKTTLIGISDATVFVGYDPTGFSKDNPPTVDNTEDAFGILATGIDVGMVFATPIAGQVEGYSFAPFFAVKAQIDSLTFPGLPTDIVNLTFAGLVLTVNSGGNVKHGTQALSTSTGPPATSIAVIDWNDSFEAGGLEVPTDSDPETAGVLIDLEDPINGISATQVVFSLSDFVYVSGGFAFTKGAVEHVDLETSGLNAAPLTCKAQGNNEDPGGETLACNSDASRIWNLEVVTTVLGITHTNIFVGYNPGGFNPGETTDPGTAAVVDESELTQFQKTDLSPDAVGVFATDFRLALVFATATPGQLSGLSFGTFFALKGYIGSLDFINLLPDEFAIDIDGIGLEINRAAAVTGAAAGASAVIMFAHSFDRTAPEPDGLLVPTGEGNTPIYVDSDSTVIGVSATKVAIAISDFVYVSGGFSFRQGETKLVDITTEGLTLAGGANALATTINGLNPTTCGVLGQDTDPGGAITCASRDGKHLWNVPVQTTLIGISNAAVFVGYNPNAVGDSGTSFDVEDSISLEDLSADAVGLWASGINLGLVFAKVVDPSLSWRTSLPKFWALRAEVGLMTPVGFPTDVFQLVIRGAGLSLNRGGAVIGDSNPENLAWIDWAHSFPGDPEADPAVPVGLAVPTGTDNPAVYIDFDDPIIGVEAEDVLLSIGRYVFVEGGFSFVLGGRETVTIDTGLTAVDLASGCAGLIGAVGTATVAGESVAVDETTCGTLTDVDVKTVTVGIHDANIFLGYNPSTSDNPFDTTSDDLPGLSQDDLADDAIGLLVTNANLGLVIANLAPSAFQRALSGNGTLKTPTFISLLAHAEFLGLVGLEDFFNLKAWGATVQVNIGGKWQAAPEAATGPAIDWAASQKGFIEVPTGGNNPAVIIDYDGYLIGGGVNRFVLSISDFVFLTGGFYFEFGPTRVMPLTDGIASTSLLTTLGLDSILGATLLSECPDGTAPGTRCIDLRFLTIGAQDVYGFVGSGPYFDADENGNITFTVDGVAGGTTCDPATYTDPAHDCLAVTNADAVGLVIEDVDFALALMTPTNRLNPMRFIALDASVAQVALVGIEGLTASATDLKVKLNISTPTLYGLPVLPVVDFAEYARVNGDEPFAVKVAAPATLTGPPVTVEFTFDSPLIMAQGTFDLNVFGILALRGSLAVELGPTTDVTLEGDDETVVEGVTTMTFGGSHLLGFIGINGPLWTLDDENNVIYTQGGGALLADGSNRCYPDPENPDTNCQVVINEDAVGLGILDLNFGIFIGAKVDPTNPAAYVAADIDVTSFGFYGLSGFTAIGTLALMLNLGLAIGSTTRFGAIDFKKSFDHDPDGEEGVADPDDEFADDDPASAANQAACSAAGKTGTQDDPDCDNLPGLAVNTGDETNPIILDFETTFIQVQLAGVINIADVVQALGVFYLEVSPEGLKMFVDAQLLVGPDMIDESDIDTSLVDGNHAQNLPSEPLLQIGAMGVLIVNSEGVAADFAVSLGLHVEGITLDVRARLILNSTEANQELRLPDRLYTFLQSQAATSDLVTELLDQLQDCSADTTTEKRCYVIDGRAPVLISGGGADEGSINALLGLSGGNLTYESEAGAYVVVALYGSFEVLDFANASGLAAIKVSSTAFEMVVSIDFQLGPSESTAITIHADGVLGIYADGVYLDVNVSLRANLLSIFDLDVHGSLTLDTTTNQNKAGLAETSSYFHVNLSGHVSVLHLITLDGTLDIAVADGAWSVSASLGAKFGPLSISASGWIRSSGSFSFEFNGSIDLSIAGTGLEGGIHARAAFCDFGTTDVDAIESDSACLDSPTLMPVGTEAAQAYDQSPGTLNGRLFLIELDGHVDVKVFGVTLAGAGIEFLGVGSLGGEIVVKAKFSIQLLFWTATVKVTIAHFYLPVALINADAPPPNLAFLDSGTGVLTLNVGDLNDTTGAANAGQRRVNYLTHNEDYQVRQTTCDPDPTRGCTVVVTAFGSQQTFTGVKSIVGDFGSGDDQFTTVGDLTVPATLTGGSGGDALVYQGSGVASLDGGTGDDYLKGGSGGDTLLGGLGDDFLDGGAGDDTITAGVDTLADGQSDDDTVYGFTADLMGDSVTAGKGTDRLVMVGAAAAETLGVGVNGSSLRFTHGSDTLDVTGFESLSVYTQGGDTVTLNGALDTTGLAQVSVVTAAPFTQPAVDGNPATTTPGGQDKVIVILTGSADTTTLTGGQEDALPLVVPTGGPVEVEVDAAAAPQVATTHTDWAGHYNLTLSGTLLTSADLDTFTLNALAGDDTIRIASLATQTTINAGAGDDTVKVGSKAATTNTGGRLEGIAAPLTVNGDGGSDTLAIDDTGETAGQSGTLTSTKLTGFGLHSGGLTYGGMETIGLGLGSGGDSLLVTSTASGATTTIHGNGGNDSFDIQSVGGPTLIYGDAGNDTFVVGQGTSSRTLDAIDAYLEVHGGDGTDSLTASDTADASGDIGYVTDDRIAGLGMATDSGHAGPDTAWSITITGATGGTVTLTFAGHTPVVLPYDGTAKGLQDAINALLGTNAVTVTRSPLTRGTGTTYLIRWTGAQTGAPPALSMTTNLQGSGATALLAQMSDGAIHYDGINTLAVDLGSGDDLVDVDSTPTGATATLDTGSGDDVVTVETTGGTTTVTTRAGDDVITVNALPDAASADNGLGGRLTLDGGLGSDIYTVRTWGTGDSRVDVVDELDTSSGSTTDSNYLIVEGSSGADTFLLRKGVVANLNTAVTAPSGQIQVGFAHAELVTYDNTINGSLVVNTLAGDDTVAFDDNSTITTVNGGIGNDTFLVGQMYGDVTDLDADFPPEFTDTTRGMLTNGVSESTTINGGAGNDVFSILRNKAMLQLNGEDGDDTFIVRTFAKEGSYDAGSAPASDDAHTDLDAGQGNDHVSYVMNAPVSINGGAGFDTVVVIGTEFDDTFVISGDGVWGAGRYVGFVAIEKIDVDGAEGNDSFVVVSTRAGVQTRIFGGLGSDTVSVGTSAPIVVADDLQGHSGIIANSVESTVGNWAGLPVDGIAASITDDDEAAADIVASDGGTLVRERDGASDSVTITLSRAPTSDVRITLASPYPTPDEEAAHAESVLLSLDGVTWSRSITFVLNAGHLSQTIHIKAVDDAAAEGERIIALQWLVDQADGDQEYDGLVLANVYVRVIDDDAPGVTVVADDPVRVTEGNTAGSSYSVALAAAPTSSVTVTVTAGAGLQVRTTGGWGTTATLTFTTSNWATAQTVLVRAIDDVAVEGTQFSMVTAEVTGTTDTGYADMIADDVTVLVYDDDTPGVEIVETDGGTHVVEGGDTDSYRVRLTGDPSGTVTFTSTAIPTKTLDGDTAHNDVQVELSLNGIDWFDSVTLTFDSANWDDFQTIYVRAKQDSYVDGDDYQAFASRNARRVFAIQGPLYVFGGENPDADYSIPPPIVLPGETSQELVTTPNPNFDMIESDQVDTLVVDNANDVADGTGTLTGSRLTGFGMGDDQVIQGHPLQGGITYADLELLRVLLGTGSDTLTVESTHLGRTVVDGGAGDDTIVVRTIDGHTILGGNAGDDHFSVGGGAVDGLDALLLLDGGAGQDSADLDGRTADEDLLATITQHSVTGMQMQARDGIDRVYTVSVHAMTGTFTITLVGIGSHTFAVGASAVAVQQALQDLLFPDPRSCGLPAGTGSTTAQDSRCAASVWVEKQGDTYYIGFSGEVAGDEAPALTSTQTDLTRVDGVGYWSLEGLIVRTGSGNDGVNVRGTTAHTTVLTGAGDDLVFVSDAADLGNLADRLDAVDPGNLADALAASGGDLEALLAAILNGTLTIDDQTFHGSLDLVTGALDIDGGAGSNSVAVSDRGDSDADGNVVVTSSGVTGLAPAAISWTATGGDLAGQGTWTELADSGLFGHGIMVMMGSGGNTGSITSVRGGALAGDPFGATITTIWTGEGDDTFTISANAPAAAARLVILGQGGHDSLTAVATATQPLVLFGGPGADTLTGGAGNDQVFGDDGRVYYLAPSGSVGYDVVLGGAPVAAHLTDPRSGNPVAADDVFLTPDVLRTALTSVGTGDILDGAGGNDILLGGKGSDTSSGGSGNDLLLGDFGWIGANAGGFVDATRLPLSMTLASHPFGFVSLDTTSSNGAADTINGNEGNDILLGQQGGDTLNGGTGDDDIIGGHNVAGGYDGSDTIAGGAGNDVVVGDNGTVLRTGSRVSTLVRVLVGTRLYLLDTATGTFYSGNSVTGTAQRNPVDVETRAVTILDHSTTTARALYGADTITGGDGNDLIFGELGNDVIRAGNGDDYVEGNGGNDTVYGGLGQDDLIGGSSNLFGLTTRAQRPDGSDLVHGGDGTRAARNDTGDTSADGHATDADVLVGDNGDVFRIVGVSGTSTSFRTFNYDDYGTLRLIPRVVQLLDYSPTGGAGYWDATDPGHPVWKNGSGTNIGAGDFLHGEGGDDVIHGMTGDDALFGDGQDDDVYGEEGEDWISGGAGTDGIIGDDGLVITSRNGSTEPLNGLTAVNRQRTVRGSGPQFTAVIFPRGVLNKAVDLEPFTTGYDDVIYGGLGDDFIHGGVGDDAISGGEAIADFYTADPLATLARYYVDDDPLQWNRTTEKFRYYNPNNPRQLITVCAIGDDSDCLPFFLTNDVGGSDGADAIFGDTGNDWISGGTGSDHLYGGWGFDLLNADDDTTTNPANDTVDTAPAGDSYGDFAYGGAAYDVLIGNSRDERLIDWLGEYNSYIVPFDPFGSGAVWRAGDPGTVGFLYDLAAGDGADQTRGGDTSRHGEPFGELGLVLSSDAAWGDQSDTPQDPQPGNGGSVNDALSTTYTHNATPALSGTPTADDPTVVGGTLDLGWLDDRLLLDLTGVTATDTPVVVTVEVRDADGNVLATTEICLPPGGTGAATVSLSAADLGLASGTQFTARWEPSDDPASSTYRLVVTALG